MFLWARRISIWRLVLFYLALLLIPPLLTSAVLLLVDSRRKHQRLQGHFMSLRAEPEAFVGESRVQIFTYGQDVYEAMLHAIENAQEYIFFETFIWKGDETGQKFKQALIQASERGVRVYVVYDQFANLVVPRSFKQFPPSLFVLEYPLFTIPWNPFSISSYARNHRKTLSVDGKIAFVGGYNVGKLYATQWRDTHMSISAPGAWEVENTFIDFWNGHKRRFLPGIPELKQRCWDPHINVLRNDPPLAIFPIRSVYLEAIDRALHHVYLTNAYFIPDKMLLRALLAAAKRGVDVRILVPAISNHVVADWISRGLYTKCLRGGIRLLLYQGAMVHAKTATIDGVWSTVGTANMDRLSLLGNFEVNAELFSEDVARQMEKIFLKDTTHAYELTLAAWLRRPLAWKLGEHMLRRMRILV